MATTITIKKKKDGKRRKKKRCCRRKKNKKRKEKMVSKKGNLCNNGTNAHRRISTRKKWSSLVENERGGRDVLTPFVLE